MKGTVIQNNQVACGAGSLFGEREKNAAKTRAKLGPSLARSTNKTASYAANLVVILPINTM